MLPVLTLLALLAGTTACQSTDPALAQSIEPYAAGARYCQLRSSGIDHDQSLTTAIRETLDLGRVPVMVTQDGKPTSLDVIDFARVVVRCGG